MLSDRPYMRSGPDPRRQIPMVGWLLIVNAGVFLLQNLLQLFFGMDGLLRSAATGRPGGGFLGQWFVLSIDNLANGKVWTLLTYSLLHGSLFHLLANFLLLFFVGRMVEQLVGRQGLLRLYLLAVLGGGLLWSLVHLGDPRAMVIGASGGAIGFLIYFCLKRPNEPITLLLFFVLPVTVLPKWVGWAVLAIGVFGLAFSELGPQPTASPTPPTSEAWPQPSSSGATSPGSATFPCPASAPRRARAGRERPPPRAAAPATG